MKRTPVFEPPLYHVRMLRRAVRSALRQAPYELRRRDPRTSESDFASYDLSGQIQAAANLAGPHSMLAAEGVAVLYQQAAHCEQTHIEGAFVECGVWHGGSAMLMAQANLDHGPERRTFHLFDSFIGIPEARADVDGSRLVRELGGLDHAHGQLQVAWDYAERGGPGSEFGVRTLFDSIGYPQGLVNVHEGWFQETLPRDAGEIGPIALLHLDGDLYESTRVCLEFLYDSVVPGGFVNVNDYGTYDGCRRAVDEFCNQLVPRPFLAHVNQDIRYWIKAS